MALYSPEGRLAASYSKIHLFRLMDEDQYLAAGTAGVLHELPWGCAGLAICYDLRFPELFRRYALEGARLLILPAAWPHPRRMHWRTLLRSRAIENQCFVAACNRVGTTDDVSFFGFSRGDRSVGRDADRGRRDRGVADGEDRFGDGGGDAEQDSDFCRPAAGVVLRGGAARPV